MPVSIALGVVAAMGSAVAYGSFAVPIKDKRVLEAKVDALVFQSYKGLACFLTSWLVLLWADGFRFTWWASLGAIIWVTDGTIAVLSVRAAGLGVAQSMWSGVSVFVSFAWGKSYFREPINNVPLSLVGLFLMVAGMVGLGYVASHTDPQTHLVIIPVKEPPSDEEAPAEQCSPTIHVQELVNGHISTEGRVVAPSPKRTASEEGIEKQSLVKGLRSTDSEPEEEIAENRGSWQADTSPVADGTPGRDREQDALSNSSDLQLPVDEMGTSMKEDFVVHSPWDKHCFALGIVGATVVGLLAGTMLVPLKLAPADRKGDQYLVSFGIGVAMVTLAALGTYFVLCKLQGRHLPKFHVRVTSGPAILAGTLWSIGNYLSIIATDALGIAVGWPLTTCAIVVSNSWAIFYYKEVTGRRAIAAFFGSTALILVGMVFLGVWGL